MTTTSFQANDRVRVNATGTEAIVTEIGTWDAPPGALRIGLAKLVFIGSAKSDDELTLLQRAVYLDDEDVAALKAVLDYARGNHLDRIDSILARATGEVSA